MSHLHVALHTLKKKEEGAFANVSTGKLVVTRNPGNSGNSGTEGNDEDWPHNLHISTNYVLHMETVFSIVRQRYVSA